MSLLNDLWSAARPSAPGKFLYAGEQKLWVRGVTYGTFRPSADGALFPSPATVRRDFAQMAAAGFNAVRTYTAPPPWLLDLAADHGLRVMVGLCVAAARDLPRRAPPAPAPSSTRCARTARQYASHPALLAVAIGNEIPAPIVRWHGAARGRALPARAVRSRQGRADPGGAGHLRQLPADRVPRPAVPRLRLLQRLPARPRDRSPLPRSPAEPRRRPAAAAGRARAGQPAPRRGGAGGRSSPGSCATALHGGVAGAFVFAWTDEWHSGGHGHRGLGLRPHPRATARPSPRSPRSGTRSAELPCPHRTASGRMVSVVVCSYNGARTIRDSAGRRSAGSTTRDYEVIVVDDGSTDATARHRPRASACG